ncbi:MAG: 2-O-(6-phospho-alpha-D-mannosyl)-D-glycerate hydrolase [Actinomycetota bacterium]|nr:2-O-(6-phospho-alpha-D-mannosyl)-D-glycerate hydrolase [Actinomycetota bacterium]
MSGRHADDQTVQENPGDNAGDNTPGIVLVPHTHWDREWYEPFQVFRFRLVSALDTVLEMAEADPDFRFTLDGQTAAIEDYLQMRPENTERIRAIVESGQLAIGPWLILLDEFLSTGETIVRNLQIGWREAEKLGGSMSLGYLPDMFGHIAQMPQILARAGMEHTAFWRGVPGRVDGHAFRWVAPDGSSVRAEYLFDGYGNGLDVLLVPDQIPRALRDYRELTRERWGNDPILGMAGTDHMPPNRELMNWVRRFDEPSFPIRIATLEEYVTKHVGQGEQSELRTIVGELRSHARGNILPGVISIRLGLKEAMATSERIVGEAERLAAAWSTKDFAPFLDVAWRKIIESTAHDSVVGSGTDETVEQVGSRLAEAGQVARAVRDGVLADVAATVPSSGYLVANPLTHDRLVFVEAELAAPDEDAPLVAVDAAGTPLAVQEIGRAPIVLGDERMDASQVERVLRRIHRRELFGQDIDTYTIEPNRLVFNVAEVPDTEEFDLLALGAELRDAAKAYPGEWEVHTIAQPRRDVLVAVPVPASGLVSFTVSQDAAAQVAAFEGATVDGSTITNGIVSAVVAADGTVDITGADGTVLAGAGRIVDGSDRGDSYNYGPLARDLFVETPLSVEVETVEAGPVRAILRVTRHYALPIALSADVDERAAVTVDIPVETLIEVRLGEPFIRLTVSFVNQVSDHRLRMHVPLPERVTGSSAEGQFAVTERGLTGEGGWGEFPIPTYPATSFVTAGAATVLLDHATEYEVVGDGTELALTLVRAVGAISVNLHPLRDEPAANEIPIPGGQELGTRVTARFAVLPSAAGWQAGGAVRLAEQFRSDGLVRRGLASAGVALPAARAGIAVDGDDIAVSSVRSVDGGTELRIVAMSPKPATATISGGFETVATVDLLGRELDRVSAPGSLALALAPWEIRSIAVS